MNRSDAIEATIAYLRILFPSGRVEATGEPAESPGKGECFKLFDARGQPNHILGLTAELLDESASLKELLAFLGENEVKRHLADAGTNIVWLGTQGYLD